MTAFNDRLKALRKQKGLSQRALAEKLEMSKSAVSMYESGFREPDHETTEKIRVNTCWNMGIFLY